MACFLVPAAEAVVTTVATKAAASKEKKEGPVLTKIPLSRKLRWLDNLLWGGSALLAYEHLWHGEIVPYFPFLTQASAEGGLSVIFHEMSTVGVGMASFVTLVWGGMVLVSAVTERKAGREDNIPAVRENA